MPFVDFAEIRERLNIEDAADMLPVKWDRQSGQLRATCPIHGGDRALIVTPAKGLFVCKASPEEKNGGDCIALCAHVMQTTNYEAGQYLAQQIGMLARKGTVTSTGTGNSTVSKERATVPQKQEGGANRPAKTERPFDTAAFAAKLAFTDEVGRLGFTEDDAERFQVGFYRGRVYVPLRHPDGSISCFLDCTADGVKLPARNRWLESDAPNVVRFPKSA